MKIRLNHFLGIKGSKEITRRDGKKYTVRNNRQRFFFPDEWMAFYDALKKKQKITFEVLINTGARINEARNIRVLDIDFERGNIVLRVTKRIINKRIGMKGAKGQAKIRIITISTKFVRFLRKIIKDYNLTANDYIPILSTPAANIGMKKALQKVGIQDVEMFSVHNVRKTLETWLMALNVDGFKLIKHFGHSFAVAAKHYVSADVFGFEEKKQMRMIIGDLYER